MKTKRILVGLLALGTFCSVNAQQFVAGTGTNAGTLYVNPITTKVGIGVDGTSNLGLYPSNLIVKGTNFGLMRIERTGGLGASLSIGTDVTYPTGVSLIGGVDFQTSSVRTFNTQPGVTNSVLEYSNAAGIQAFSEKTWNISSRPTQLRFYTISENSVTPVNRMIIQSDGGVGIGTTYIPSAYKLAVNGDIIATGVTVMLKANWPDYVFKNEYKLRPLQDVETYIKANSHLPEVPSEAEVKETGINVSEMNATLLKKVEELTLYMIQQQKEIEALKTLIK